MNNDAPQPNGAKETTDIVLPEVLVQRIQAQYKSADDIIQKVYNERDTVVRSMVLGYLSSVPGAENLHYELSADGRRLVQK